MKRRLSSSLWKVLKSRARRCEESRESIACRQHRLFADKDTEIIINPNFMLFCCSVKSLTLGCIGVIPVC